MSKLAVYPGSFDPFTLGHLDVAKRALSLFDRLEVLVVHNPAKAPTFSPDERVDQIRKALAEAGLQNVTVSALNAGLLATHCAKLGATAIVKGVRNDSDLQVELPQARVNRDQSGIETAFLPGDPALSHISSSLVRQVAELGGDISKYVPSSVLSAYTAKQHAK
jgi:pantetheine-phosphate adenylyltransferase